VVSFTSAAVLPLLVLHYERRDTHSGAQEPTFPTFSPIVEKPLCSIASSDGIVSSSAARISPFNLNDPRCPLLLVDNHALVTKAAHSNIEYVLCFARLTEKPKRRTLAYYLSQKYLPSRHKTRSQRANVIQPITPATANRYFPSRPWPVVTRALRRTWEAKTRSKARRAAGLAATAQWTFISSAPPQLLPQLL
jgi:hypothetical protein